MKLPRLSNKEYVILDLLRSGVELYGLELVKTSDGQLKRGTVYVTLDRMSDKGLVTSRKEKSPKDAGMPRRLYQITGEGRAVLSAVDAYQALRGGGVSHV